MNEGGGTISCLGQVPPQEAMQFFFFFFSSYFLYQLILCLWMDEKS